MQGGTVVLATAPFDVSLQGGLEAKQHDSGLGAWLAFHGVVPGQTMVLDEQNSPFPVPADRQVGIALTILYHTYPILSRPKT